MYNLIVVSFFSEIKLLTYLLTSACDSQIGRVLTHNSQTVPLAIYRLVEF